MRALHMHATRNGKTTMKTISKFCMGGALFQGGLAAALGVLVAGAGCGGPQKTSGGPRAAARADQGGDDIIMGSSDRPARRVSEEEREDFVKAMARYRDLKADGTLSASECESAAAAFEKAADNNPNLREARFNQGAVLLECGRDNEAMQVFQGMASGTNAFAPAVTELGVAAFRRDDRAQAEQLFTRAIDLDQNINSVTARNNLAQLLRDQMQAQSGEERKRIAARAITHLRAVLAMDGSNIQAYATLCHVYQLLGYPEMAKLVADQAIRRAQEIATGEVEEEGGSSAPAKAKSKKRDRDDKEFEEAPRKVKTAKGTGYTKEMNEQIALVYNTLALIELEKQNVTGAISNLKSAIGRDPNLMEARMNLAAIALNFRDYNTAEDNFKAVMKAQPANYEAVIGLGVALRGNRKADEAEQMYLAAQKLEPNNPKSYYNLGLLYQDYKGGQKPELQKAQQYFRDYLGKASGGGSLRRDAQKRIKDIDDMFAALEEAEKLQAEYEKMLKEAEEQQRRMQEEMQRQGGGEGGAAAAPGAATDGATAATTP